jgi:hypothetical protein
MIQDIRNKLSEYLEFDCDRLFQNKYNLIRIFGGAIRDIIAEQPINDVDILCGSKAFKFVEFMLHNNGYKFYEHLNGKDLQEMYSDVHVICEPHTWIKGDKVVQIIKPSGGLDGVSNYTELFNRLLENVDLSCCGVSYDGELHEDFKNAIVHCKNRVFSVNPLAKMYSHKRISHRVAKLEGRGWSKIENTIEKNRDLKLNLVL